MVTGDGGLGDRKGHETGMNQPDLKNRHRGLEWALLAGIFALLAVYVSRSIWNIDVFWHIAAGRAFLEHGGIPSTDIFSAIEPDRTWVTFQWGYQVWVYLLDEAGGLGLVRAMHAGVMFLSFGLFWWGCRRRLNVNAIASALLLLLIIVLFSDRIRSRPHVFNLLFWAILFPYLAQGLKDLRLRHFVTDRKSVV